MPDWARLLRRKLGALRVGSERRDEILRELAGFLEDRFEERLGLGESPRVAARTVIVDAGHFPNLARDLERVEDSMPHRLKTLWVPAFAVSLAAVVLLYAVARTEVGVQVFWRPPRPPFLFYWPWLLALPLIGAAGALWSRREGGTRRDRLLVATFPALTLLGMMLPVTLVRVAMSKAAGELNYGDVFLVLLNWIVLPAVALLLGALPLLREDRATRTA